MEWQDSRSCRLLSSASTEARHITKGQSSALQAMARGDGFSGPDPAKEFLKAWAMVTLTGAGFVSVSGGVVTVVVGSAVGAGSNVTYQMSTKDIKKLKDLNYIDASVAAVVGGLSQGKGLLGTVGTSMGGAYVGSQIKGEDATVPVIGAGVGAAAGYVGGGVVGNRAKQVLPDEFAELPGATVGSVISELVSEQTKKAITESDKK